MSVLLFNNIITSSLGKKKIFRVCYRCLFLIFATIGTCSIAISFILIVFVFSGDQSKTVKEEERTNSRLNVF